MRQLHRSICVICLVAGFGSFMAYCAPPLWVKMMTGIGLAMMLVDWIRE